MKSWSKAGAHSATAHSPLRNPWQISRPMSSYCCLALPTDVDGIVRLRIRFFHGNPPLDCFGRSRCERIRSRSLSVHVRPVDRAEGRFGVLSRARVLGGGGPGVSSAEVYGHSADDAGAEGRPGGESFARDEGLQKLRTQRLSKLGQDGRESNASVVVCMYMNSAFRNGLGYTKDGTVCRLCPTGFEPLKPTLQGKIGKRRGGRAGIYMVSYLCWNRKSWKAL